MNSHIVRNNNLQFWDEVAMMRIKLKLQDIVRLQEINFTTATLFLLIVTHISQCEFISHKVMRSKVWRCGGHWLYNNVFP